MKLKCGLGCLVTFICLSLVRAGDIGGTCGREGKRQDAITKFLSMPFNDLIRVSAHEAHTKAYKSALFQRQEFENIDWHVEDCATLARQLWGFQSAIVERTYNKQLSSKLKLAMMVNQVPEEKINKVLKLLNNWIKARSRIRAKEALERRGGRSSEVLERTLSKKRMAFNRAKMDKTFGRSKSLLSYMQIENIHTASPEDVLEEALKYRGMYRSSRSYIQHLRIMWKTLKYKDEDVIIQNTDPRNYKCEEWNQLDPAAEYGPTSLEDVDEEKGKPAHHILESHEQGLEEAKWAGEPKSKEHVNLFPYLDHHFLADSGYEIDADTVQHHSSSKLPTKASLLDDEDLLVFSEGEDFLISQQDSSQHQLDPDDITFPDWTTL